MVEVEADYRPLHYVSGVDVRADYRPLHYVSMVEVGADYRPLHYVSGVEVGADYRSFHYVSVVEVGADYRSSIMSIRVWSGLINLSMRLRSWLIAGQSVNLLILYLCDLLS